MSKRRLSVGWPRRNPRHYRFPLPNTVWDYKFKPIEFLILSYLCCQHSHGGANLSPEMIAKVVHVTVSTVKKYLSGLADKELITSEYAPTFPCAGSRKFFTLPNEIFLLNLPPSAFMVYAYLLLIEDRRTHTCHPSYGCPNVICPLVLRNRSTTASGSSVSARNAVHFSSSSYSYRSCTARVRLPTKQSWPENAFAGSS